MKAPVKIRVMTYEQVMSLDPPLPGVAADDPNHQCWAALLWQRVHIGGEDDCWPWAHRRRDGGYGWFECAAFGIARQASHLVLELTGDPRPSPEHLALHSCDFPPCVNRRHLSWGTAARNAAEAVERERWTPRRTGFSSRITSAVLDEIIAGDPTTDVLFAVELGVGQEYVSRIRRGRVVLKNIDRSVR